MSVALAQALISGTMVVALMLGLGCRLSFTELAALRQRTAVMLGSIVVNVLVIPIVAIAAARSLELPSHLAIGFILCCSAPGGPVAALYANLAKVDLAFTAAMTIILPAIGVVSAPLFLSFAADLPAQEQIPVLPMIGTLIALQLLPLLMGMAVRRYAAPRADWLATQAARLANVLLGLLVLGLLIAKGEVLLAIDPRLWLAICLVCALTVGVGYLAGGRRRDTRRAGVLVALSRNVVIALLLAATFFTDPQVDAAVLAFGFVTFVLPMGFALAWRPRTPAGAPATDPPATQPGTPA